MMDSQAARASQHIEEVKFRFSIDNVKDLRKFFSDPVYVHGTPWAIEVSKSKPDPKTVNNPNSSMVDDTTNSISVFLWSQIKESSQNWAVIANATVRLKSTKTPLEKHIDKYAFTSSCTSYGQPFIEMDALLDPLNGYVNNDGRCEFIIRINAGHLQDVTNNEWIRMESLRKCCDYSSDGKFRFIVHRVGEFYGVCSPIIRLQDIDWRISLVKAKDQPVKKGESEQNFLRIQLDAADNRQCRASMACEIIPFDRSLDCVKGKIENEEIKFPFNFMHLNLIRWSDFEQPHRRFIENDSFVVDVKLKIVSAEKRRREDDVRCAVYPNGDSANLCDHMFCKPCIDRIFERSRECQVCAGEPLAQLQSQQDAISQYSNQLASSALADNQSHRMETDSNQRSNIVT